MQIAMFNQQVYMRYRLVNGLTLLVPIQDATGRTVADAECGTVAESKPHPGLARIMDAPVGCSAVFVDTLGCYSIVQGQ